MANLTSERVNGRKLREWTRSSSGETREITLMHFEQFHLADPSLCQIFKQKILQSGCVNISQQTLAYSELSDKFAYVGNAHVYCYDTRGMCKLDSIVPFCEEIQSASLEEQKGSIKVTSSSD